LFPWHLSIRQLKRLNVALFWKKNMHILSDPLTCSFRDKNCPRAAVIPTQPWRLWVQCTVPCSTYLVGGMRFRNITTTTIAAATTTTTISNNNNNNNNNIEQGC
jgi:hypothetical protein